MPLTQEQVAERVSYIGGSDAAAVLGLSRWSTPLKVWAEKTGQIEPDDLSDNQAVEMGMELEETVCRIFTKRTGKKVARVNETIFHPKHKFLAANIDRRVVGEDAILEAKTCSGWRAKEFENEEIPQEYLLQVMHYLAVTGKQKAYLAILIGGQDFRWKEVQRDDKLISDIVNKEVAFWTDFVIPKVMPMTITKNDSDTLYSLFPTGDEDKEIVLDDSANTLIESRAAMIQDNKNLEAMIDKADNELKAMLMDATIGRTNLWVITWKNQARISLDTKAIKEKAPDIYAKYGRTTETRVLRVKGVKEK